MPSTLMAAIAMTMNTLWMMLSAATATASPLSPLLLSIATALLLLLQLAPTRQLVSRCDTSTHRRWCPRLPLLRPQQLLLPLQLPPSRRFT